MRVGIVGCGTIGSALGRYFKAHDIYRWDPAKGLTDNLENLDVLFVAVNADMRGVMDVVREHQSIARVVAVKTTLRTGTTDDLISEYGTKVMYCPEFVNEDTALEDMSIEQYIIGAHDNGEKLELLKSLYPDALVVEPIVAELAKLATNVHHALKVTFANEVYDLCGKHGADYEAVRGVVESDRYITANHLDVHHKGYRGFGGKCLEKDARMFGGSLVDEALRINERLKCFGS